VTREAASSGRSWRWVALLAALHFLLWMLLFFVSLDFAAVDDEEPWLLSQLALPFVWLLGVPGWPALSWLAESVFTGEGVPDALEWGVLLGSSLLWGIALEAILRRCRARG
jgi:hypothetical protein